MPVDRKRSSLIGDVPAQYFATALIHVGGGVG